MISKKLTIQGIPAILWGKQSDKIYIHVHGKMSCKESAAEFAQIAETKGWGRLSALIYPCMESRRIPTNAAISGMASGI